MEPITAVLKIVGAYGVMSLVKALGGNDQLAQMSRELFQALDDSESRIDARLSGIESQLQQILEQRYEVALGKGVRYFLSAGHARVAADRKSDLKRAREEFTEASYAARSSLQRAVAERYLLLCLLAMKRLDLAPESLRNLENAATASAFESMFLSEFKFYQIPPVAETREFRQNVRGAALDSLALCGRLLAEAAALAPAFSLPQRIAPPTGIRPYDGRPKPSPQTPTDAALQKIGSYFFKPTPIEPIGTPIGHSLWRFKVSPNKVLQIGSMAIDIVPETTSGSGRYIARLKFSEPISLPVAMSWVHGITQNFSSSRFQLLATVKSSPVVMTWSGWRPASSEPMKGTVINAGTVAGEVFSPSVIAPKEHYAVRINPAYTANHFIIVELTT